MAKIACIEAPLLDEVVKALDNFEYERIDKRLKKKMRRHKKKLQKNDIEVFKTYRCYLVTEYAVLIFVYEKDVKKVEKFFNKTLTDNTGK